MQANYTSIFSFGDSYTDTGNLVILYGGPATPGVWIAKPPYGMTFFAHPTGRASDGRLAIDFIGKHCCLISFRQYASTWFNRTCR
jgi:hypothetical protein